jgi:hypothetical protein
MWNGVRDAAVSHPISTHSEIEISAYRNPYGLGGTAYGGWPWMECDGLGYHPVKQPGYSQHSQR